MKKTLITLICLTMASAAFSQPREIPLESIHWLNPWIGSGNMAGLAQNSFLQEGRKSVSEAEISFSGEKGDFHNVFDPSEALILGAGTESYLKVDKVFLYGRFNYEYERDGGNTWRGSLHPYETPFLLADPVDGDITDETYSMQAGMAVPFGAFTAGLDVSYDVGIMAKLKDLRNRNTDMRFRIAPGLSWTAGPLTLGISAGYRRGMEKIEYTQIAGNVENYLYYIYGLWFYNSYGYSSAETSRLRESGTVFGSLQADLKLGDWRIYDSFGIDCQSIGQTETGYNNLKYGNTRTLGCSDRLVLQNGDRHRIIVTFASAASAADRYLQQQELDPDSGIRRYVSYGDPVPCWTREVTDLSLEYGFRRALRSEFKIGAAYRDMAQTYESYPISATQKFVSIEPYAEYTKYIPAGRTRIEISPAVSWRHMLEAVRNNLSVPEGALVEGSLQLEEPLNAEADWMGSDFFRAALTVGCDFGRIFTKIHYSHTAAPSPGTSREYAALHLGLAF